MGLLVVNDDGDLTVTDDVRVNDRFKVGTGANPAESHFRGRVHFHPTRSDNVHDHMIWVQNPYQTKLHGGLEVWGGDHINGIKLRGNLQQLPDGNPSATLRNLRADTLTIGETTLDASTLKDVMNSIKFGSCTTRTTPWNIEGSGDARYLDRHNVACPKNEVLSSFQLRRRRSSHYELQYRYTCCALTGS